MDIKRNGSQPAQRGPAEHFTGTVRVDPMFQSSPPARAGATFETSPPTTTTHVAVQESLAGKAVEWLGKVTDQQYEGKTS